MLSISQGISKKQGSPRFITGSYDRTCKVWDTMSGQELLTLDEHKNVVYALAFNNPYGDKIVTGSFDRTAKVASLFIRFGIPTQERDITL